MMLMRQPTETSRGSGRTGGARLLPAAGANRSASRRSGRPADARICWIIRGTWGRITLLSRAVRPRRGATRPRLILAVPAMWKSSESTRRRGLQFDPLEGRQLLNGSYFPAPHAESASMSSGSTIGMAWISGHDGGTPGWDGAGPAIEQRGVDPQAGDARPGGPVSLGGSDWSTPGWDRSTVTFIWAVSSASGTLPTNPMAQLTDLTTSATSSNPSGVPPSGGMAATVGGGMPGGSLGSSASANNQGPPGGAPPGGFNPAAFLAQERSQDMAPPLASMNPPPLSPAFFGGRDRTDAPEFGATVTAPLTATVGVGVPGVQTPAPLGGNLGSALVTVTQAPQAAPTGATVAAQPHSIVVNNDTPAADRARARASVPSPGEWPIRPAVPRHRSTPSWRPPRRIRS